MTAGTTLNLRGVMTAGTTLNLRGVMTAGTTTRGGAANEMPHGANKAGVRLFRVVFDLGLLGLRIWSLGMRAQGLRVRVQGSGFRV
jgi:hypothetical protein